MGSLARLSAAGEVQLSASHSSHFLPFTSALHSCCLFWLLFKRKVQSSEHCSVLSFIGSYPKQDFLIVTKILWERQEWWLIRWTNKKLVPLVESIAFAECHWGREHNGTHLRVRGVSHQDWLYIQELIIKRVFKFCILKTTASFEVTPHWDLKCIKTMLY